MERIVGPVSLRSLKSAFRLLASPSIEDVTDAIRTLRGDERAGDTAIVDMSEQIRARWLGELMRFPEQNVVQRNETVANVRIGIQAQIDAYQKESSLRRKPAR